MRCNWANNTTLSHYHDHIYGHLTTKNEQLFEILTLEIFQPGLSFAIVWAKRAALQAQFANYDLIKIANMDEEDVQKAMNNPAIIRHYQKIWSVIENARLIVNRNIDLYTYTLNAIDYRHGSDKCGLLLSKFLKQEGWKFVGPSVCTSYLAALGLISHHQPNCNWAPASKGIIAFPFFNQYLQIEYHDYTIIKSSYVTSTTFQKVPSTSFEQYLKYIVDAYLNKQAVIFKLNLKCQGTSFQLAVWDAICHINYGETLTYGDVAAMISLGANRAVGSASSKTPHALFIPAHRLVAKNGIGGFQGNNELKKKLLAHEQS